jgi:hypothetical protein
MSEDASLIERLRPLLAECSLGEQLYIGAVLENRSGDRYRQLAAGASDAALARGLRECAEREDAIAERLRAGFHDIIRAPADLARLLEQIQGHVVALFGGHGIQQQFQIQARVERGGEGFWKELAASEADPARKALLLECAALEAQSAAFLERLRE